MANIKPEDQLRAIADAIREKTGSTAPIRVSNMPQEIRSIETGSSDVPFPFGGFNATKFAEYDESWTLDDTSFVKGSSSSTSATSILASTSNKYTNTTGSPTIAFGDKDIVVVQTCKVTPTHGSGATKKAQQIGYVSIYVSYFSKRKTTDTSAKTTRQVNTLTAYMVKYYNTSGVVTRALANYGFYMTPSTPTVANATSASTYLRCGSPVLYYRASTTYETTANIKTVTDCAFNWHIDAYTVDEFSSPEAIVNDTIDEILSSIN